MLEATVKVLLIVALKLSIKVFVHEIFQLNIFKFCKLSIVNLFQLSSKVVTVSISKFLTKRSIRPVAKIALKTILIHGPRTLMSPIIRFLDPGRIPCYVFEFTIKLATKTGSILALGFIFNEKQELAIGQLLLKLALILIIKLLAKRIISQFSMTPIKSFAVHKLVMKLVKIPLSKICYLDQWSRQFFTTFKVVYFDAIKWISHWNDYFCPGYVVYVLEFSKNFLDTIMISSCY